jgi:hypothetical protein
MGRLFTHERLNPGVTVTDEASRAKTNDIRARASREQAYERSRRALTRAGMTSCRSPMTA